MPSTTTPAVDVGVLAASIQGEAAERMASTIASAITVCEETDNPLNELQRIEFTRSVVEHFDGFERAVAAQIIDALSRESIEVWGLPPRLEDVLPGASDAS